MHVSPQVLHKTPQTIARFFHAGAYEGPKNRNFPPHTHQMWEVVYYRSGYIGCPIGDEYYESQPGMILVTPPGVVHAEEARTAYTNFYIHVEAPPDHPWPRVVLDDLDRTFGYLCSAIVREYGGRTTERAQTPEREQMLSALMTQLDILLRRSKTQLPESEVLVRKVEQLLDERFATEVVIQEIAREVGVSPSHLRAQFMRLRNYTPMSYLQSRRVQQALAMLRTSDLTLEIIAGLCGYYSASHLSRHVKRVMGQRPGAFRGK